MSRWRSTFSGRQDCSTADSSDRNACGSSRLRGRIAPDPEAGFGAASVGRGVVVGAGVEVGTGTAVEVGVGVGLEQANTEASTRKIAQDRTFNIKASLPLRLRNLHLVERGCHSTDCISGHQDQTRRRQPGRASPGCCASASCCTRSASPRAAPAPRAGCRTARRPGTRRATAVERLDVWVLPRRAGLDVAAACAGEPAPVAQGVGRELGPLVATDVRRRRPVPGDDPLER